MLLAIDKSFARPLDVCLRDLARAQFAKLDGGSREPVLQQFVNRERESQVDSVNPPITLHLVNDAEAAHRGVPNRSANPGGNIER